MHQQSDERLLTEAVKRASLACADGKVSPTDAMIKVAKELKLLPGMIKIACSSFNVGRQLSHRDINKGALDKLAEFPLAEAEKVISAAYQTEKKAEEVSTDYNVDPVRLAETMRREKLASMPLTSLTKSAAAIPGEMNREAQYKRLSAAKTAARSNKGRADSDLRDARDFLSLKMAELVNYFRQPVSQRLPVGVVEKVAQNYHEPALVTTIIDTALSNLAPLLKSAQYGVSTALSEKRAGAEQPLLKQAFNPLLPPFGSITALIKVAQDIPAKEAAVKEAEAAILAAEQAMVDTLHAKEAQAQTPEPTFSCNVLTKQGGILQTPAFGAAVGSMIGRSVGMGMGPGHEAALQGTRDAISDPSHEDELRRVRVATMLNSAMTDPDNPLSGHDPDRIMKEFNNISHMAPNVAQEPAVIIPLLQRRLAGPVVPFENKEIVDLERGVMANKGPSAPAPTPKPKLEGAIK